MAGAEDPAEAASLVGWRKNFNTVTLKGRANCGAACVVFYTGLFLYFKFKPSKAKQLEAAK